ncbi:MAG: hypothetical protein J5J06_17165 [Phycisphaerae bacterium]|nr:hypothetical protein [Phycisphaerae bacterium]
MEQTNPAASAEHRLLDRARRWIMLILIWLIAVYVYDVVTQSQEVAIGLIAAAATIAVNLYARKKAVDQVTPNFAFNFWMYVPAVLFLVIPIVFHIAVFIARQDQRSIWQDLAQVMPFLFKLGLPAAALLWTYYLLGRCRARMNAQADNTS